MNFRFASRSIEPVVRHALNAEEQILDVSCGPGTYVMLGSPAF